MVKDVFGPRSKVIVTSLFSSILPFTLVKVILSRSPTINVLWLTV